MILDLKNLQINRRDKDLRMYKGSFQESFIVESHSSNVIPCTWKFHYYLNKIKSLPSRRVVFQHVLQSTNDMTDMLAKEGALCAEDGGSPSMQLVGIIVSVVDCAGYTSFLLFLFLTVGGLGFIPNTTFFLFLFLRVMQSELIFKGNNIQEQE